MKISNLMLVCVSVLMCEGAQKMRVRNFSARFLKARKIGTLKSFTLSCNARIQLKEKSL